MPPVFARDVSKSLGGFALVDVHRHSPHSMTLTQSTEVVPDALAPPETMPRPRVLGAYERLFAALEEAGADYCVWKNVNELPGALLGLDNIDLYVRPASRAAFLETLRAHRFVRVETHKGHPWVAHYYGLDEPGGTLCHLHCYFRLVTGESHIKQYVVPIERHLDRYPSARNALGVREMHPALQRRLHLFRRRIKLSCLPGAALFYREREGYRAERALLERGDGGADTAAEEGEGWPATIAGSGPLGEEIASGLRYRHRFAHWNRFAPFTTPLARYGAVLARLAGKLRGRRKTLPLGMIVAVSGAEEHAAPLGRALQEWLGGPFQTRLFRLPDNDARATDPAGLLRLCRRRERSLRTALRASAGGAVCVCHGHDPRRLHAALAEASRAADTSPRERGLLARHAARLDDAPSPDLLLQSDATGAPPSAERTAVIVAAGDTERRWRAAVWRALTEGQP